MIETSAGLEMQGSRCRVAIVDDHPLFRQGLLQLIGQEPSFECVGVAADGVEALELLRTRCPDVVILDVNLPRLSGLEVARQLRREASPVKVVILTMNKDAETFNRALDLGVLGYVLKDDPESEVLESVRAVAAGRAFHTAALEASFVDRTRKALELRGTVPSLSCLTKAERRILRLVAEKKTSKQIADELSVSYRTIETHRSNICAKLAISGTHSLLQFAIENRAGLEVVFGKAMN